MKSKTRPLSSFKKYHYFINIVEEINWNLWPKIGPSELSDCGTGENTTNILPVYFSILSRQWPDGKEKDLVYTTRTVKK